LDEPFLLRLNLYCYRKWMVRNLRASALGRGKSMGLSGFLNAMFGCTHKNYSFPFTPKDRHCSSAAGPTGTYVVCLGCGKELPYDWREMKIVHGDASELEKPREVVSLPAPPLV
jgi:hypothetical protein